MTHDTAEATRLGPQTYSEIRHTLRKAARHLQRKTVACCGLSSAHSEVAAYGRPGGAVTWGGGLAVCGSPWCCPTCAGAIGRARSAEVADLAAHTVSRGGVMHLATLTLRHGPQHTLADLCAVLTGAWARLCSGRWGQAWRARLALDGYCRGTEVTWGRVTGWHPHMHLGTFGAPVLGEVDASPWEREQAAAEAAAVRALETAERADRSAARALRRGDHAAAARHDDRARHARRRAASLEAAAGEASVIVRGLTGDLADLRLAMALKWQRAVISERNALWAAAVDAGVDEDEARCRFAEIAPDLTHGFDLRRTTAPEYAAKMGWEIAGVAKVGRSYEGSERLSQWEFLQWASVGTRTTELQQVWREYAEATYGMRALTWSRGLRGHDETDEELAQRYMHEAPPAAWVESRAYADHEAEGRAWWLGAMLVESPEVAAEYLVERGYAPPRFEARAPSPPRPRFVALTQYRRSEDERREAAERERRRASMRIALWGAARVSGNDAPALHAAARSLDELGRLARGEHIPCDPPMG